MNKAIIFDIQRNSFVDGPGIRTTVFFKGCNLKCTWCHNPEGQRPEKEILFYRNKCTGCGKCKGLTAEDNDFICHYGAKEICGKEYTADEILSEIAKDKRFYLASGGGVTFSGGECMLQVDFLAEILKKCRQNGIHTAVDTAGNVPFESFEKIIPYADMFLYDIKSADDGIHRKYTGVSNKLILENLAKLLELKVCVWVRIPVIPSVNDTEKEMCKIKAFFEQNGYPEKIEFLPYHAMGEYKYEALGRKTEIFAAPDKENLIKLKNIIVPDLDTLVQ